MSERSHPDDASLAWVTHPVGYRNQHEVDIAREAFLAGWAAKEREIRSRPLVAEGEAIRKRWDDRESQV